MIPSGIALPFAGLAARKALLEHRGAHTAAASSATHNPGRHMTAHYSPLAQAAYRAYVERVHGHHLTELARDRLVRRLTTNERTLALDDYCRRMEHSEPAREARG